MGWDMMSRGGRGEEGEETGLDGRWTVSASGTRLDDSRCDDRLSWLQNHASLTMNQ